MSDRLKTILIGLFIFAAIISSVYIILFMEPQIGDGKKILKVRFSNIAGINVGTRVTMAGKAIGEVISIKKIKDARNSPIDELGRIYFYELKLKVDSSVEVLNTDEITIATTGLLGEKSIAIIPKAPKKGQIPKNISSKIIYAQSVEPLENLMYQITSLSNKMEKTIDDFDTWFVENQEELSSTVSNLSSALKQIDILADSVNKEKIIDSVKKAINSFTDNMVLVKESLEEVQENEMIAKMDVILENLAEASEYVNKDGSQILVNLHKITEDIANAKGSLGKFIKNDDFYLRTVSVLSKIDTLMNDINHYGILFQYDKHWQRIRTKRMNIIKALDSPKEFRTYFEREVDGISTALERISVLVEKSEEKETLYTSKKFQKNFAELLRDVEHLLDTIKLYNEELVETINKN